MASLEENDDSQPLMDTPAEPAGATDASWRAALYSTTAVMLGRSLVLPILVFYVTAIAETEGRNPAGVARWVSLVGASFYVGNAVSGLVFGHLSDACGRRPAMLLSLAGMVVGFALQGVASTCVTLAAFRALAGFFCAAELVGQAYVTDTTTGDARGAKMSQFYAYISGAFVVGPAMVLLSGLAFAHFGLGENLWKYRVNFMASAAINLAMLAVAYSAMRETRPEVADDEEASDENDTTNYSALALCIAATLLGEWGNQVWMVYYPMAAGNHYKLNSNHFAAIFMIGSAAMTQNGRVIAALEGCGMSMPGIATLAFGMLGTMHLVKVATMKLLGDRRGLLFTALLVQGPIDSMAYALFMVSIPTIVSCHVHPSYVGRAMGYRAIAQAFGNMLVVTMADLYTIRWEYPFYMGTGLCVLAAALVSAVPCVTLDPTSPAELTIEDGSFTKQSAQTVDMTETVVKI